MSAAPAAAGNAAARPAPKFGAPPQSVRRAPSATQRKVSETLDARPSLRRRRRGGGGAPHLANAATLPMEAPRIRPSRPSRPDLRRNFGAQGQSSQPGLGGERGGSEEGGGEDSPRRGSRMRWRRRREPYLANLAALETRQGIEARWGQRWRATPCQWRQKLRQKFGAAESVSSTRRVHGEEGYECASASGESSTWRKMRYWRCSGGGQLRGYGCKSCAENSALQSVPRSVRSVRR